MNYFTLHFEAAKNAVRQLFKQPLATLLILVMLAIAMSLPLALYLGVQSSQAVLGKLNESPQITLYMEQNADEADSAVVKELLAADKRIEKSEFIGKAQGLSELQTSMGEQDIISMLDSNQKVLAFLSVTLSVAFVLVAHNTIRLQILSRKEEIEITKLLGAPSSFIRRPFLYQAVWQSLLAAGLSLALCAWLRHATQPLLAQIFRPYGLNIEWRFFHTWEWLSVCGIVAALGIAGAWLATRQHLLSFKAKR